IHMLEDAFVEESERALAGARRTRPPARPSSVSRARYRGRPPRAPWSRRRAGARRIINEVERS
ncbi:hypothetical protein AQ731_13550, partial [Burkholderia pseudomallei]